MQVKLDKISEWTTTGFELSNGAYQYAPINAKNHFARGKDEFVIWGSGDDGTSYGIVWIKAGRWSFIPSPAQKKSWNKPVLLDTGSDILIISGEDKKAWWVSSPEQKPCEVVSKNLCAAENITEISTLGEKGVYPIICRVDGEVFAANSFTSLHYDNETHTLHWDKQLTPVFTNEKVRSNFMQSLGRAEGIHHKMDFSYSYPQIGSLMIKDNSIYAFVESDTINPCRLSQFKYYWYLELTQDGIYKRKIWGKEKLEKLAQKHGLRGKFSAQKEYLILSPIFKTDEWKGKQKLLRLSDQALLDITFPKGYSKFRIMDIWDNHVFISDEVDHITLCRMVV